jgi:Glycosyl hydrolase family 63 C-terminal domain
MLGVARITRSTLTVTNTPDPELLRLLEDEQREKRWKLWGTYLSERQWGTVREDYSAAGNPWTYFPHDHARSRAYRWGEDGLFGLTDEHCRLCFALALWNGADPILKERLFGLTGPEGNHGEDVKELYYYEDATPTHSYCRALYKYPHRAFPYQELVEENGRRSRDQPEYELLDTGVFSEQRYFDVTVEYAKATPSDVLIRLTIANRGAEMQSLHLLPTLWFRNTWSWGEIEEESTARPRIASGAQGALVAVHETLGTYHLAYDFEGDAPECLYTDNETNAARLFGVPNARPYVKDAIHDAVIQGRRDGLNPAASGTKAALHYRLAVAGQSAVTVRLRLTAAAEHAATPFAAAFDDLFRQRINEADQFFATRIEASLDAERTRIARAAYAGLLWSKQFYNLVQSRWSSGDPAQVTPPPEHASRNADWMHLYARDVLSMPDKWEFPYFCSWDSSFHCVSLSKIDPGLAKRQLVLFLREWYMHRNGELPAYEFAFSDVNPPVHPWAVWRVYRLPETDAKPDRGFLERAFQKLLLNFTWWVNREDRDGNNIFAGGFLGLDNIGVFDRSKPLPNGATLQQADGTAWMAFYCVHMLSMALELARDDDIYQDMASKFLEHFGAISHAINGFRGAGLWDEEDGFYYDRIELNGKSEPLRVRAVAGFIPMLAATIIRRDDVEQFAGFVQRAQWDAKFRPEQLQHSLQANDGNSERLLSVLTRAQLERLLHRLFDEDEFLSPFGIRSLSRFHEQNPSFYAVGGETYALDYEPGEGTSGSFGGNSNWRGPVWFPINYLILESLRIYHLFYGESLRVEFPTRSGQWMTLGEAARNLAHRLQGLFLPDAAGHRPCNGSERRYAEDPHWQGLLLFSEYFHADTGRGCGASHQTGWTALIADLMNLEPHWTSSKPGFVGD